MPTTTARYNEILREVRARSERAAQIQRESQAMPIPLRPASPCLVGVALNARLFRAVVVQEPLPIRQMGNLLLEHWNDRAKVDQLLGMGNVHTLAPEFGETHPFDAYEAARDRGWTTFYNRDRRAVGSDAVTYSSYAMFTEAAAQYNGRYSFFMDTDNVWQVGQYGNIGRTLVEPFVPGVPEARENDELFNIIAPRPRAPNTTISTRMLSPRWTTTSQDTEQFTWTNSVRGRD